MALALLDILGVEPSRARVRVDTGTNRYFQLKLGTASTVHSGFDWIDGVVHQTPVLANPRGGGLLDTATEVTVPLPRLPRPSRTLPPPRLLAQLFTYRTEAGQGIGFSPVLPLEPGQTMPALIEQESTPTPTVTDGRTAFAPPRTVACRTVAEQFSEPRLDDLLAQIIRVAAPVVLQAFGGQSTTPAAGAGSPPLGGLVDAIVRALPGLLGQLTGGAQLTHTQSLLAPAGGGGNRFVEPQPLSRPMVFGIDDAVLGSLIGQVAGPLLNVLPQLMNSANQRRLQLDAQHNQLMTSLVGDVERRMLLQQVLQAQQQAPAGQSAELQQLASLLQQAGASVPAPAAPPAATPPATSSSLAVAEGPPVAARAVATFVTAPALTYPGGDAVLYARGRDVTFQVKLAVGDPVPKSPLPKAIIRVVVKDPADQRVLAQKVVKQHGLAANATTAVPFTADELAAVPAGRRVTAFAEIRWLVADGTERNALGSQEAVFVDRLFAKSRGPDAGPERELTDMARFRPFWNKLWESPVAASDKTLWGLDVTMRYTVLLTTEQSNGVMQTRLSSPPDSTTDDLRVQTSGKMKAGLECSIDELAKLSTLWDGEPALDADHVAAFRTAGFAEQAASDAVTAVKLEGPRDERGVVWVVPVLKLVDYTLGAVGATDEHGQVTDVKDEHAHLPLPVAIRVLSLRSGDAGDTSADDGPQYHFDGYRIDRSEKVTLTPHG
jgi:hypothetical protein